jgi:hypothetical protein
MVSFPSLADAEAVELEFVKPDGSAVAKTLLIDSGFTGQSSFVLSDAESDLMHAAVPTSQVGGALHGAQNRALVVCRISALAFQKTLIAIFADLAPLALLPGIDGMAGLRFLRQFERWGAELTINGTWQFYLSIQ